MKELSSCKTTQMTQSQQVFQDHKEHEREWEWSEARDEARSEVRDNQIADVSDSMMISFQM